MLVVAADAAPTLAVQFHGAIVTASATATQKRRQRTLNAGAVHNIPLTVTAPGLLTLETTGSTDTIGMLNAPAEVAHAESGGSGGNFKFAVPVNMGTYTAMVEGQTSRTSGDYTVGMDFKVAMTTAASETGVTVVDGPEWTSTEIESDDGDADTNTDGEQLQIDGSTDEDYFLFTIDADSSGLLTVNANDDGTAMADANTSGNALWDDGDWSDDGNTGRADCDGTRIAAPATISDLPYRSRRRAPIW